MNRVIADGVWPTMITPYTEDNKIDYEGVLKIIEWYDQQNVTGIFAVCQSSEMFFLSKEERLELANFIVKNTPKHMGVIASGHVAESLEDQIEEAKAIINTGISSYVFISNQFAKVDECEEIAKERIEMLMKHIPDTTFGVYECPYPYKRLLSPELLKWCAETGRFSFLKDTCCDLEQLKAKVEAVKGSNLKIYNANAATLLESLKMGCAGYSGVMTNFHARLYAWLCDNFEKEPEKAQVVQDYLGFASMVECQIYPVNAKYHMQLEGINITLNSRTRNKADLTSSRRLEIEQFRRSNQLMESYLGI